MQFRRPSLKQAIILTTCIGLAACYHDEPVDIEPNQAFGNALTQISNVSNKTEVIISEQTDESVAYESLGDFSAALDVLNSFFNAGTASGSSESALFFKPSNGSNGNMAGSNTIQQKISNTFERHVSIINSSHTKHEVISQFADTEDTNDDSLFDQQEIDKLLSELFNPPTQNGNTYTYTLKSSLCEGDAACLALTSSIKVELVVSTKESGIINFITNDVTTIAFTYSPTLLSSEVFLEGIKELSLLVEDANSNDSLPTTFAGSFKFSVELLSDTEVEIIASIPQAIDVNGQMDGDPIEFILASTSKLLAIKADSTQNTASLELGFGMLYAKYMGGDENNPSVQEVSLKALTALFDLDVDNDAIVATNIGIGDEPLTLTIDGMNATTLEVSTFGFDVNGGSGKLTLTSDFDISYSATNVNGELGDDTFDLASDSSDPTLTGEFTVMAPNGTVLTEVDSDNFYTDITKIVSGGPVTMTGSGYFSSDFTINSGQCIESTDDSMTFGDGITITECL